MDFTPLVKWFRSLGPGDIINLVAAFIGFIGFCAAIGWTQARRVAGVLVATVVVILIAGIIWKHTAAEPSATAVGPPATGVIQEAEEEQIAGESAVEDHATFSVALDVGGHEWGSYVEETADGGYFIAGRTTPGPLSETDVLAIKTDETGNVVWQQKLGGSEEDSTWTGQPATETADGGFVVVAKSRSYEQGEACGPAIRMDTAGRVLWERTYRYGDSGELWSVREAPDGRLVMSGLTTSHGDADAWLMAVGRDGSDERMQAFGGATYDGGYCCQPLRDGHLVLAGAAGAKALLLEVDSTGSLLWTREIAGPGSVWAYYVCETPAGGFVLIGESRSGNQYDVWLCRTDSGGNTIWQRTYGGTSS